MTGKTFYPNGSTQHDIKCTVNDALTSFTVADNEKCSFGLYDRDNHFLGYINRRNTGDHYPSCAAINGAWDIVVRDAPEGAYVKPIESFFIDGFGIVTKQLH